jgi:hypothetical protein
MSNVSMTINGVLYHYTDEEVNVCYDWSIDNSKAIIAGAIGKSNYDKVNDFWSNTIVNYEAQKINRTERLNLAFMQRLHYMSYGDCVALLG